MLVEDKGRGVVTVQTELQGLAEGGDMRYEISDIKARRPMRKRWPPTAKRPSGQAAKPCPHPLPRAN
jgi:hypothetical protein